MKKIIILSGIFLFIGMILAGSFPDSASAQNAYNCKKEGERCGNPGPGEDNCCESGTVCSDAGALVFTKSCRRDSRPCKPLGEICGNPGWGEDYCCSGGAICTDDGQGIRKYCKSNECKNEGEKCGNPGSGKDFCCKTGLECSDKGASAVTKSCRKPSVAGDKADPPPPPPPAPPCEIWNKNANGENTTCKSLNTGLGTIATDAGGFISKVFGVILAASGGIALLLIIRAGYKIMTSQGNPEKVKEGREQLTSAIVGLLFLIFSFVLLQLIGVDILKIPGLS